jgi:hypothetical protein
MPRPPHNLPFPRLPPIWGIGSALIPAWSWFGCRWCAALIRHWASFLISNSNMKRLHTVQESGGYKSERVLPILAVHWTGCVASERLKMVPEIAPSCGNSSLASHIHSARMQISCLPRPSIAIGPGFARASKQRDTTPPNPKRDKVPLHGNLQPQPRELHRSI